MVLDDSTKEIPEMNKNFTALTAAFAALANSLPAFPNIQPLHIPARKKVSKKRHSKKAAIHKTGDHFKPVYLLEHEGKPMTPAQYRRLHMGVTKSRHNGPKSSN